MRWFPNSNSKSNGFTCRCRQRWLDTLHLSSAWILILWQCSTAHYASDQLIISFQSEDAAKSIHPSRTSDGKRMVPMYVCKMHFRSACYTYAQGWLKVTYNTGSPIFKYEKIELLVCTYEISRELVCKYGNFGCSRCLTPATIVNPIPVIRTIKSKLVF